MLSENVKLKDCPDQLNKGKLYFLEFRKSYLWRFFLNKLIFLPIPVRMTVSLGTVLCHNFFQTSISRFAKRKILFLKRTVYRYNPRIQNCSMSSQNSSQIFQWKSWRSAWLYFYWMKKIRFFYFGFCNYLTTCPLFGSRSTYVSYPPLFEFCLLFW